MNLSSLRQSTVLLYCEALQDVREYSSPYPQLMLWAAASLDRQHTESIETRFEVLNFLFRVDRSVQVVALSIVHYRWTMSHWYGASAAWSDLFSPFHSPLSSAASSFYTSPAGFPTILQLCDASLQSTDFFIAYPTKKPHIEIIISASDSIYRFSWWLTEILGLKTHSKCDRLLWNQPYRDRSESYFRFWWKVLGWFDCLCWHAGIDIVRFGWFPPRIGWTRSRWKHRWRCDLRVCLSWSDADSLAFQKIVYYTIN